MSFPWGPLTSILWSAFEFTAVSEAWLQFLQMGVDVGSGASSWCRRSKRSNQQALGPCQLDPRGPEKGEFARGLWRPVFRF